MADTQYNPRAVVLNPYTLGGIGDWENDFAPYAGGRSVTVVHDLEASLLDGAFTIGTRQPSALPSQNGTVDLRGTPTLPVMLLPPDAAFVDRGIVNQTQIAMMALSAQLFEAVAVAGVRRLRMEVYGKTQFAHPVMEVFDLNFTGTGGGVQSVRVNGTRIFATVDAIKITHASGLQTFDVLQLGPFLGNGGSLVAGAPSTNANGNPRFALPCRVNGKEDILGCRVETWGRDAVVPYTQGQGAGSLPTQWVLGKQAYQGATLATATAHGLLVSVHETVVSAVANSNEGRIFLHSAAGLFNNTAIRQDFNNDGTASPARVVAVGATGEILQASSWDGVLDYSNYRGGEKMTVDTSNTSIYLSNAGTGFETAPISNDGWQSSHSRYKVIITVRTSVGVPGRGEFQDYWKAW